ncbi:uncharacterized protein LOC18038153 isoform X1 [Citrus clementina]|uniref:uncharacterized protein LOC18038153 isoform X1 n=1 Tax=Citrus clementina TaxID=85681 RepID=UPI000CECFE3E|nr:uncharacterized protein LOC18038153 isoform X1 [Citrus x clementina]
MAQVHSHSEVLLLNKFSFCNFPSKLLQRKRSCSFTRNDAVLPDHRRVQSSSPVALKVAVADDVKKSSNDTEDHIWDGIESDVLPHIQTLRRFPKVELAGKVALVRFDSTILLNQELDPRSRSVFNALFTIKYLLEFGAKVILASDWSNKINSNVLSAEYVADVFSSALKYQVVTAKSLSYKISLDVGAFKKTDILLLENLSEFKEEVANCSKFAQLLSSGVDIFVNDSFSLSHKILASTVGVAPFCYACVAGFHFEESLFQLRKMAKLDEKPYAAIIGGGNLCNKAAALHFLASRCDGLIFVGLMSFQIMHALGLPVPPELVEKGANDAASDLIQFARDKHITILYPKDFWCTKIHHPNQVEIFPSHGIPDGWEPVDIGPRSVEEITSTITKYAMMYFLIMSQKVIWVGPVKFRFSSQYSYGASKLTGMLCKVSQGTCNITVIGSMACKAIAKVSSSIFGLNMVESGSAVWEFLKGRMLPGVSALDRAFPFDIDWSAAYHDPAQPLVVDIGSGNGLFLLGMARKRKDLNFLGLEVNGKVLHCNKCYINIPFNSCQLPGKVDSCFYTVSEP